MEFLGRPSKITGQLILLKPRIKIISVLYLYKPDLPENRFHLGIGKQVWTLQCYQRATYCDGIALWVCQKLLINKTKNWQLLSQAHSYLNYLVLLLKGPTAWHFQPTERHVRAWKVWRRSLNKGVTRAGCQKMN